MNNFEIQIIIKDGQIVPVDKLNFRNYFSKLVDGVYTVIFKRHYKKATQSQFGWLFGSVFKEMQKAMLSQGHKVAENIKAVEHYCMVNFADGQEIVNTHTGVATFIPKQKRDFTTLEMATFVDAIRNHAAEEFNYIIPEANPNWKQELKD